MTELKTHRASGDTAEVLPLVSIVMPVYNSEEYLSAALNSMLWQTYENIELICVNDGSSDESLDVLRSYAERDSRVVVVSKENSGAASTRNEGMKHVRGKYMCFVDSDDFIEPDAIGQLVEVAERYEVDAVVFGLDYYDNLTGAYTPNYQAVSRFHIPPRRIFRGVDIDDFYRYLVGFTVNKLYRTSFLKGLDLEFPLVGAHEDMPFTYIALSAAKKLYYHDKVLYHYRRFREGSLSDTTNFTYSFMFDALNCLRNGLIEHDLWSGYQRIFENYVVYMAMWKHGELGKYARMEFRDSCRTKWFEELGVLGHDRGYFFDPDAYGFVEIVMNMPKSRIKMAELYRRRKMK